jgi:hypothetical protein
MGTGMVKRVRPYRSVRDRGVYHDRADCPVGKLIHSEELAQGTGERPHCEQCEALEKGPQDLGNAVR